MEENIQLKLIGITYNQIESGVYALILEDIEVGRRLAIVIGYPEAQSIECKLQNVKTPRPLTHDLLACMLDALGGKLLRVDIHRMPTGPYAGKLTVRTVFGETCQIDARSSDAIALAIRVGAPIFTTRELLEKEGYVPGKGAKTAKKTAPSSASPSKGSMKKLSLEELEAKLSKAVLEENYEEAARIKQEIDSRKCD